MRFFTPTPMTYAKACELISTNKSPVTIPLTKSVGLEWDGQRHHITLGATRIVTINPDGSHTIRTGGWFTKTTQERISRYSHCPIKIRQGEWWVVTPQGEVAYQEGMQLLPN